MNVCGWQELAAMALHWPEADVSTALAKYATRAIDGALRPHEHGAVQYVQTQVRLPDASFTAFLRL